MSVRRDFRCFDNAAHAFRSVRGYSVAEVDSAGSMGKMREGNPRDVHGVRRGRSVYQTSALEHLLEFLRGRGAVID